MMVGLYKLVFGVVKLILKKMRSIRIVPKLDIKGPNLVEGVNLEGLRTLRSLRNFIEYYYKNRAGKLICHDGYDE